jgi:hypothetical protein
VASCAAAGIADSDSASRATRTAIRERRDIGAQT